MTSQNHDRESMPQALNKAMREAVDFIHAEGWDAPPTLFGLVPARLLVDVIDDAEIEQSPLALVVQDELPDSILPGSDELGDYISRVVWPDEVVGAILAQEIMFSDAADPTGVPRAARLFSGVLRSDAELTLLQLRPTEEELAKKGPFAEDDIELRGGPGIAPGVIAALKATFE
ncbi:MAG: PPA1309 family protein [Corynebacterium sp.]|uniref:PPA1309 family protein n=1 Tax=Corynebacterium sp. TaxID=1720 RepID=UPI0026DB69C5|nr:PPA1309 family protein [Corynebacterium sp.]MDO5097559.1 PPA1309 family protein [Corynebacterium sp.]